MAMTRRYALCCLFSVALLSLQGCVIHIHGDDWDRENSVRGSGHIAEDIHPFTGITGVQLATLGELEIQLGDTEELRIEADDNLLPFFETRQTGDTLRIGTSNGAWLRPSRAVRYTLTVKELNFIGLSSSGNAHAPTLSADRFEIHVSSSGHVSMEGLDANTLDVTISSSGSVTIDDGTVDEQDIRITSSGSYDGERVRSDHVVARLSSSGSARVWAEDSIDARLSSSGSVSYAGDPKVFESESSSGRVRRIR